MYTLPVSTSCVPGLKNYLVQMLTHGLLILARPPLVGPAQLSLLAHSVYDQQGLLTVDGKLHCLLLLRVFIILLFAVVVAVAFFFLLVM